MAYVVLVTQFYIYFRSKNVISTENLELIKNIKEAKYKILDRTNNIFISLDAAVQSGEILENFENEYKDEENKVTFIPDFNFLEIYNDQKIEAMFINTEDRIENPADREREKGFDYELRVQNAFRKLNENSQFSTKMFIFSNFQN